MNYHMRKRSLRRSTCQTLLGTKTYRGETHWHFLASRTTPLSSCVPSCFFLWLQRGINKVQSTLWIGIHKGGAYPRKIHLHRHPSSSYQNLVHKGTIPTLSRVWLPLVWHCLWINDELFDKHWMEKSYPRREIDSTNERELVNLPNCWRLMFVSKFVRDSQAYKSPVVVKGPFLPRVVNPRYRIRGTNVW
jgi:hypothetical protein